MAAGVYCSVCTDLALELVKASSSARVLSFCLREMAEQSETRNSLVFAVNGERFELSSVDPSTTVLEFLRSQTRFKSVKLSCGEGWFLSVCVLVCYFMLHH